MGRKVQNKNAPKAGRKKNQIDKRMIVFGDVHLVWQAVKVILDYAREHSIDSVLTLGDEGHKMYPYETGDQIDYDRLYHELRSFRDERSGRSLVCCIGDKTACAPRDMKPHFVGLSESGKVTGSVVYQNGNILAAHMGEQILKEHKKRIESFSGLEPLVIFHGHSHSMGVLPQYVWLQHGQFVDYLKSGEEQHKLEPGKVYWVNPGAEFFSVDYDARAANFAIYDPASQLVILKTIVYDEEKISPSKQPINSRFLRE